MEKIGIIGLGYVGLPLAVEFGKIKEVIGYDINESRIAELKSGKDSTLEIDADEFKEATKLRYTANPEDMQDCSIYIITVPTPIDDYKRPDLTPLIKSSETVGKLLNKGDVIIYESTVYPGAKEYWVTTIKKVTSGSTPEIADKVDALYRTIITAIQDLKQGLDEAMDWYVKSIS